MKQFLAFTIVQAHLQRGQSLRAWTQPERQSPAGGLGGFLFLVFALFGYWVDYVARIEFRNPIRPSVLVPYVVLYLATVMFYWWPLGLLSRPLWFVYAILFVIATILNLTSH